MQVSILIEPKPDGGGYIARTGAPFDLVVERSTVLEAMDSLEAIIRNKVAQVFHINTGPAPTRIRTTDGLPDDELTRAWLADIEEYRRECDEQIRAELEQMEMVEKLTA